MTDVMKPTAWRVDPTGTTVTLTIGNLAFTLDYPAALQISKALRVAGKRAKAMAGDSSVDINVLGLLTDAESDELEAQNLRDSTARFS